MNNRRTSILIALIFSAIAATQASAEGLQAGVVAPEVMVTPENFKTAATHWEFTKYLPKAGGVNHFAHIRAPYPADVRGTVRPNRDTLYSFAIVDVTEGATLSIPEMGDRYVSAMIINEDHYVNKVYLGGGEHPLTKELFDTDYVFVAMRTLVDSADPEDVAAVNALQDQYQITAGSAKPFIVPNYNRDSFKAVLELGLEVGRYIPDTHAMFGSKDEVDSLRHFAGTAFGWGGLPIDQSFYLNVEPGLPVGEYKIEVPSEVPVDQFWSITIYDAEGYFTVNEFDSYSINSITGSRNDDGTMTVHLGGCQDGRVNCIPIVEGWNYIVRQYQPGEALLDGSWTFPDVQTLSTN
ncbi:DUF1254 domain-containing protein [Ruegeria arenilitoris]|uniref:DUF1254 domain-containing protein n=1 Tax=Ruegeria arenilitoris TaxID=1173585 RepID=UPI00147AEC87|nr:DUF1254 domain-containing protein [Ruegeria arenilitoris]